MDKNTQIQADGWGGERSPEVVVFIRRVPEDADEVENENEFDDKKT